MSQDIVTAAEVGKRLGVSEATITRWARQNIIPRIVISRRTIRYDLADVLDALREGRA